MRGSGYEILRLVKKKSRLMAAKANSMCSWKEAKSKENPTPFSCAVSKNMFLPITDRQAKFVNKRFITVPSVRLI